MLTQSASLESPALYRNSLFSGLQFAGRQVDSKTVWKKEPVIRMGFTAYFKDPEGRIVGLWQSARVQPR